MVVEGAGWHDAEVLGRWAGDGDCATLTLPPLAAQDARLSITIVDTMTLDHLEGLNIRINDNRLSTRLIRFSEVGGRLAPLRRFKARVQRVAKPLPAKLVAELPARFISSGGSSNQLTLEYPKPVSPTKFGSADGRKLSVCVQSISVSGSGS